MGVNRFFFVKAIMDVVRMNLMLMEWEELPEEKIGEVRRRLNDWLKGDKGEFVSLDEAIQSSSP